MSCLLLGNVVDKNTPKLLRHSRPSAGQTSVTHYWAAVKELNFRYQNSDTLLFTTYTYMPPPDVPRRFGSGTH